MKSFLTIYSRSICLSMALAISIILSVHVALAPVLPIADGEGYATRAFALYGYLHTGQWANFLRLLTNPSQSIFPLHYPLFLILPKALAGVTSYVLLQNITIYLLLAYAIFKVSQVLNRPEWAPAIFLLCSFNNIAWIDFYAFFLDMEFFSLGLLVIALQMNAWSEKRSQISILAGIGLGLLFLLKPANTIIFLATYSLSELGYGIDVLRLCDTRTKRLNCIPNLLKDLGYKTLGFAPLLCLGLICGAEQSILQLIDQNEIHELVNPLSCGGLLRLFYFPLCLSAFYHVFLLGVLLLTAIFVRGWIPVVNREEAPQLFPIHLFIPIALSYLVLGEFFSFWMSVKPMRAVLLMAPLFWFAFCWLWEKRRLRSELFLLVAVMYASLLLSQKAFNILGTRDQLVEDNYQLTISSWTEMPSFWHRGWTLNPIICDSISRDLPQSGIICVNSIEIRNALAWRLANEALLLGRSPPYQVRNLFDYKGEYYDKALVGANVLALITFSPVQSSRSVWLNSSGILDYGNDTWRGPNAVARLRAMPSIRGEPVGYEFLFWSPLTQGDVDKANESAPFAGIAKADSSHVLDSLYGRHYSWAEGRQLLQSWFNKRYK